MKSFTTTAAAALLAAAAAMTAHADDHDNDARMNAKMGSAPMTAMTNEDHFDGMDTNRDAQIDFTEFSNYMERNYKMSASDSAKEYVRLTSGENNVITDRSFAGLDIINLPHKHLDSGVVHQGTMTSNTSVSIDQPTAVMSRTVTVSPMTGEPMMRANYGVFADYDMNRDGRVDFKEYSKYRSKTGIRTTQAAQEFIRFSDGQAYFDETGFTIAVNEDVLNRPYYRADLRSASVQQYDNPATTVTFDAASDSDIDVDLD